MVSYVKQQLGVTSFDGTLFRRLLAPSWSGLVTYIFASVGMMGALMVVTYYDGSFFDQQLDAWRTALERTSVSEPYSMYAGEPATTEQITNVGFMALLWAAFGALLYFFAAACVNAFRSRGHVHMRNAQLLAIAFVHLLIRGLALCVLLLGLWIFIHKIILYAFGAAYVAGINADGWQGTGLILLSLLLLATGMHMLVVLLRLFLLRPRLFHSTVYRS